MPELLAPVSPGELLDKITILEIKAERITDAEKLANVRHELTVLTTCWQDSGLANDSIASEIDALRTVNARLWDIEDDIRDCERRGDFGADFIRLARSVYIENDQRAAIKKRINIALGATLVEEKSYRQYR
jgi:Family of unknown function (DUF6165)